jgi:hypothetical protein
MTQLALFEDIILVFEKANLKKANFKKPTLTEQIWKYKILYQRPWSTGRCIRMILYFAA